MTEQTILSGKRILLGVTGSIAAFKAAALASRLAQQRSKVDVIMTEAAVRFIAPLTFQALTGRPVYTDMWATDSSGGLGTHIAHVGLAHEADLLLIAPCTAQTMARVALGLADNLLSVTALAARCPILLAPAMDAGMYENPATQQHVQTLTERGVHFAGPTAGRMASGLEGLGRFLEPEEILGHARYLLGRGGPLAGRRLVVTAGPTREPIDPVRYLTNQSSGKQGFAIAQAALDAGADVTLIAGPSYLPTPVGALRIDVTTAQDMQTAVLEHACGTPPADVLIMSAAVADYRPAVYSEQKIKKDDIAGQGGISLQLSLTRNPDILLEVAGQPHRPQLCIGFAAESENLIAHAQQKLQRKQLDMIVANDITVADAGFAVDTNRVTLITTRGAEELPLMSKSEVADHILARVKQHLLGQQ